MAYFEAWGELPHVTPFQ